jgi:hypothetical protein
MSAPVTVYGPAISPAVARVAACLLEKDVPFQLQPVDMSKGEHKSPSFLKLQPFGQVPAFKDHLTTVFGRYPRFLLLLQDCNIFFFASLLQVLFHDED